MANKGETGPGKEEAQAPSTVDDKSVKASAKAVESLNDAFQKQLEIVKDLRIAIERVGQEMETSSTLMVAGVKSVNSAFKNLMKTMAEQEASSKRITDAYSQMSRVMKTDAGESIKVVTENMKQQTDATKTAAQAASQLSQEMQGSMENVSSASAQAARGVQNVTDKMRSETKAARDVGKTSNEAGKVLKSSFAKATDVAAAGIGGLYKGFVNFLAVGKSITGVIGSVVGGLFSVGKAILAIPFKMMQGLFEMADNAPGGTELADALERVREGFGDLRTGASKAIVDVASSMGKLDSTGVSAQQIFGNLAGRIDAINKLATGMGATIGHFTEELRTNGEAMARYQRGLGMSEEQMESVNRAAMRMGTSASRVLNDMTKQTMGMSKAFGINAKVLSKDMARAMGDLAHFGHLSTKEMALATAYANKLGLSVDKLTASMDATATFDQAAEQMGKLNETFGTNIDATEVMMAQNPAEKFELIRKGLVATGKDMSRLTFQERMLVKQATSWDDATLDAAVSSKNFGVSLDKMSAQATKNEDTVMTQTQALKELSAQIVRINTPGPQSKGGIFDRFLDGMMKGMQSSPEFVKMIQNVKQVLAEAYMSGMRLGKVFVDLFPGVKQTFKAIADLFEPKRFQKFFDGVIKSFDVFKKGGVDKMDEFMKSMKDNFFSFFNSKEKAGKDFIEGLKKFFGTILEIFSKLAVMAVKGLAQLISDIADWVKNPQLPKMGDTSKWTAILDPLFEVFKVAADQLWPAIKKLASNVWEKLKHALFDTKMGNAIIAGSLGIILGPAIINTVGALISGGVFKKAGGSLSEGVGKQLGPAASRVAAGEDLTKVAAETATSSVAEAGKKATAVTSSPSAMMESAIPDEATLKKMESATKVKIEWSKLKEFLMGMAGVFGIGLVSFAAALKLVRGEKTEDLVKAGILMVAMAPVMAAAGSLAEGLSKTGGIKWDSVKEALKGIAAMMAIGLAAFGLALFVVTQAAPSAENIIKTSTILMAMIPVMAGAGLLVYEANKVGESVGNKWGSVIKAMGMMALTIPAIAASAAIAIKFLGDFSVAQIASTVLAMLGFEVLFAGAGLLLYLTAKAGDVAEKHADAVIAGMAAMVLMIPAIAAVATISISLLGNFTKSQIESATLAMLAFEVLFAGAALLVGAATLAGAAFTGPQAVAALAGLLAMTVMVPVIATVAHYCTTLLGNFSKSQIESTAMVMLAFEVLFVGAAVVIGAALVAGAIAVPAAPLVIAGMLAMVKTIELITQTAINAIANLGSFSIEQVTSTVFVMNSFMGFFYGASALIAIAATIGTAIIASAGIGAVAIAGGLLALDLAIEKIVKTGVNVIANLGGVSQAQVSNVSAVMDALVPLFVAANALIANAAAIGTVILGSFGAGGIAIIAGMRAVDGALLSIMTTTNSVIISLSALEEEPTAVEAKANAFSSIVKAISGMVDSIANVIRELDFGMFSDPVGEKIDKVSQFVQELISGKKGDSGMMGIVSKVTAALKDIPKEQLEIGKVFVDVLKGFTAMIDSITKPALELQKKSFDADPKKSKKTLDQMSSYIDKVGTSAGNVVTSIIKAIGSSISGLGKEQMEAIPVIGNLLKSVSDIVSAISSSAKGVGNVDLKDNKGIVNIVNSMPDISKIFNEIAKAAPMLIANMILIAARLPQDASLKDRITTIGNILDTFSKMIKMITDISDVKAPVGGSATNTIANNLVVISDMLRILAGSDKSFYPGLSLEKLVETLNQIKVGRGAGAKGKQVTDTLTSIMGIASAIQDPLKDVSALQGGDTIKAVTLILGGVHGVLRLLSGDPSFYAGAYGLNVFTGLLDKINKSMNPGYAFMAKAISTNIVNTMTSINKIGESVSTMKPVDVTEIGATFQNVKTFFETLPEAVKEINTALTAINPDDIKMGSIMPVLKAVQDMVVKTNQLNAALSTLPGLNLAAKLEPIAKGMGFGGKFEYTIKSKEVVVTINLQVTMDAGAVEKAIVFRSNSIIRDRINYALGTTGGGADSATPQSLRSSEKHPGLVATSIG